MSLRALVFPSMLLALGLACGPVVALDSDADAGTGTSTVAETTVGESADESSGEPSGVCGVNDTELFGGGPPGPLGFPPPCNPKQDPGTNGYRCCSDDPAAAGRQLPAYQGTGIAGGLPYFADANNDLSIVGQCVDVTQLVGQGLNAPGVEGCPIPCNPTWPEDSVETVCGAGRVCCQTVELGAEDCVQDPVTGLYRPITGDDIGTLSTWRPGDHQTHQDPNGSNCLAIAGGDSSSDVFQDCVRQLSVANQRGFCMSLGAGQVCPHADPSYVDACEQLNGG